MAVQLDLFASYRSFLLHLHPEKHKNSQVNGEDRREALRMANKKATSVPFPSAVGQPVAGTCWEGNTFNSKNNIKVLCNSELDRLIHKIRWFK